ncbi:MAG TPA: BrnT family toxin [Acetobacteraceae bacterium]|nr:BrnT family toxin [Acetobacteraceae bacterium]
MEYEWDGAKRRNNLVKHGVDFAAANGFDWFDAVIIEDRRHAYGERRWLALGKIGARLDTLVYTERIERKRIISLRKSKRKEVRIYEQASHSSNF